ncbi:ribonuclease HI large subunit [Cordyceps militaris CM01]|uniref:Ribonuclease n=1 Tax=Cordyceps militaris (strain CM01) TaxID=983644 RepID=G3JEN8_CORMM|nr:ribonuclease HI large subunit [Cordyceps militaris CM01]EGX93435.1 ribonuclease HI large subunit [Cordyceps militaris CM01]
MADSQQDIPKEVETGTSVLPSIHRQPLITGQSYSHFSPVPPSLLPQDPSNPASAVPCCLGVDEAGRGPVLGPMVYGVFYLPIAQSDALLRSAHHFDDSKVLTAGVRASLMATLCAPGSDLHAACGWATAALSARDIGANMLQPVGAYNLNAQAMDATVDLIRGVYARGVNVQEIYVDTIGPPATYQAKLQRIFPTAKVTVAKKADSLYACVSAASVCAKVTRDVALETLYEDRKDPADHQGDEDDGAPAWGSGYPSDGRCTGWMRGNLHPVFGWGPECRFSWGTAKDMLEAKGNGVKVEWPVDDDGETSRVTDFFVSGDQDTNELGHWFGTPAGLEAF